MSFLNKILSKKEVKEYFLVVGIEENRIIASVASIYGKEVTIIGSGQSGFDDTSQETEAADIAISEAEKRVGGNVLVEKVIFGLPVTLLDKDEIKPQHLARLKKITKALSLTPCGFIEYPEALANYLETKDESPPTLLLLSIGRTQITFSHIRVGKIENNIIVEKTNSITSDFEKALSNLSTTEILPSRIMLYDESGDAQLDDIREELSRYSWHKHTTFLHTPKIETLETEALIYALVEGGAQSLGKDLQLEEKEKPIIAPSEVQEKTVEETFGFIKNKDINEEQEKEIIEEEVELEDKPLTPEIYPEKKEPVLTKSPKIHISLPKLNFSKLPLLVLGIVIILLLLSTLYTFWYYPKATVKLIVYPSSSVSNIDVLFTINSDSIKSGINAILATTITQDVTGDKTISTTGTTKIGEKSHGEVTVYNKTLSSKTIPKGSVLITDNFKFSLDSDVTIASASDTGEGLTFGKTTAKITANEIGPEENLTAGMNFNFRDFDKSSYYAKNNDKFSGGTSRDITSVSKEDQDNLLSSLTEGLTTLAKQQILQKLTPGEKLLDTTLSTNISSKRFSKSIGDETKEIKLDLTINVSGFKYKEKDLLNLTQDNATNIPSGFSLATEKTNIHIFDAKIDKQGNVLGKAKVMYYFIPKIDIDKIRSDIAGKPFGQADKYLSNIKEIGGVEIISENRLPFMTDKLPLRHVNIQISLVSR